MNIGSVLVNGAVTTAVSVFDRSLQFGDGLFETIAVTDGEPCLWDLHIQRLLNSCDCLKITPPSIDLLHSELLELARGQSSAVVKILLTRGSSQRGYAYADDITPNRILYLVAWPGERLKASNALDLKLMSTRLGINPALAGIKHTCRLEQVCARVELADCIETEGLMLDINGHVIEGVASNIILDIDGVLHTPKLDNAGVSGVVKELIQNIAQSQGVNFIERAISIDELDGATAIYLSSSILGVRPVKHFQKTSWQNEDWNHPVIKTAQQQVFSG